MAEDIQGQLYKQLSEKYDFGDETAFRNALRSKEGAKYIYDTATQGGYDLGDYNSFENSLGFNKPAARKVEKVVQPKEQTQTEMPVAVESPQTQTSGGKRAVAPVVEIGTPTVEVEDNGVKKSPEEFLAGTEEPQQTRPKVIPDYTKAPTYPSVNESWAYTKTASIIDYNNPLEKGAMQASRYGVMLTSEEANAIRNNTNWDDLARQSKALQEKYRGGGVDTSSTQYMHDAQLLAEIHNRMVNIELGVNGSVSKGERQYRLYADEMRRKGKYFSFYDGLLQNGADLRHWNPFMDLTDKVMARREADRKAGKNYPDNYYYHMALKDGEFRQKVHEYALALAKQTGMEWGEAKTWAAKHSDRFEEQFKEKKAKEFADSPWYSVTSALLDNSVADVVKTLYNTYDLIKGQPLRTEGVNDLLQRSMKYAGEGKNVTRGVLSFIPEAVTLMPVTGVAATRTVGALSKIFTFTPRAMKITTGSLSLMGYEMAKTALGAISRGEDINWAEMAGNSAKGFILGGGGALISEGVAGIAPKVNSTAANYAIQGVGKVAEVGQFASFEMAMAYLGNDKETTWTSSLLNNGALIISMAIGHGIGHGFGFKSRISTNTIEKVRKAGYNTLANEMAKHTQAVERGAMPKGYSQAAIQEMQSMQQSMGSNGLSWSDYAEVLKPTNSIMTKPGTNSIEKVKDGKGYRIVSYDVNGVEIERSKVYNEAGFDEKFAKRQREVEKKREEANVKSFDIMRESTINAKAARAVADALNQEDGKSVYNTDGTVNEAFDGITADDILNAYEVLSEKPAEQLSESETRLVSMFKQQAEQIGAGLLDSQGVKRTICERYGISEEAFDAAWKDDAKNRKGKEAEACAAYNTAISRDYSVTAGIETARGAVDGVEATIKGRVETNAEGLPLDPNQKVYYELADGETRVTTAEHVIIEPQAEDPGVLGDRIANDNLTKLINEKTEEVRANFAEVPTEDLEDSLNALRNAIKYEGDEDGSKRLLSIALTKEIESRRAAESDAMRAEWNGMTHGEKVQHFVDKKFSGRTQEEREELTRYYTEHPSEFDDVLSYDGTHSAEISALVDSMGLTDSKEWNNKYKEYKEDEESFRKDFKKKFGVEPTERPYGFEQKESEIATPRSTDESPIELNENGTVVGGDATQEPPIELDGEGKVVNTEQGTAPVAESSLVDVVGIPEEYREEWQRYWEQNPPKDAIDVLLDGMDVMDEEMRGQMRKSYEEYPEFFQKEWDKWMNGISVADVERALGLEPTVREEVRADEVQEQKEPTPTNEPVAEKPAVEPIEAPKPENKMQPAKVETETPPIEGIEQEPFDSFTTSKGKKVNLYRQTSEKDGIKTTRVFATKDGKETNVATAHFPLPDEYEIDPAYLADGEIGDVLGVKELRESKDGAAATIVVRDENGLTLYEVKLNKKDSVNSTAKDRIDELMDAMGFEGEERAEQRAFYADKGNAEQFEKDYKDFVGKEVSQPKEEVKTEDKKDEVVDDSQQETKVVNNVDSPMPMKKTKKGRDVPDFDNATVEQTYNYLYGEGSDRNRSDGLVENTIKSRKDRVEEAQKALDKAKAKEQKLRETATVDDMEALDDAEAATKKADDALKAAQADLEKWEDVQRRASVGEEERVENEENAEPETPAVEGNGELKDREEALPDTEQQQNEKTAAELEKEFNDSTDEMSRLEQEWGDKIKDYVAEKYPTQATVTAETNSPIGKAERAAMNADPEYKRLLDEQKRALDEAKKKNDEAYNAWQEALKKEQGPVEGENAPKTEQQAAQKIDIKDALDQAKDIAKALADELYDEDFDAHIGWRADMTEKEKIEAAEQLFDEYLSSLALSDSKEDDAMYHAWLDLLYKEGSQELSTYGMGFFREVVNNLDREIPKVRERREEDRKKEAEEEKAAQEKRREISKPLIDARTELLGAYKSGDKKATRAAQKELAEALPLVTEKLATEFGLDPTAIVENTIKQMVETRKKAEKGSAEYKTADYIVKALRKYQKDGVKSSEGRVELNAVTLKDPVSRDYLNEIMEKEGWGEAERQEFMRMLDDAADVVLEMGKRFPRLDDWNKKEIASDKEGEIYKTMWRILNKKGQWIPNRSAFKKNGEYPWNIDLGTLCTKRESFDALVQLITEKGLAQNLGPTQIEGIKELLKSNGFLTACDICFNETKRARVISYANQVSNNWRVISEALGIKDKMVGDPIELAPEQIEILNQMAGRGYKSAFKKYIPEDQRREYKGEEKAGNEIDLGLTPAMMQKIAKQMLLDPTLTGKLKPETLITTEGMDWLLRTYGGHTKINELLASAWGSGTPKPIEGFNIYDPLSWREQYDQNRPGTKKRPEIDWFFNNGGFRAQSFTDYHPMLFLDYLQMFTDLGVRRLPIHIYTKVPALVKLFGGSGAKINMSLVPKMVDGVDAAHAGLKPDGKGGWEYAWDTDSFPIEEAFALRQDPRYGGNVGTIAVGLSDAHIRMMLADPTIDQVIPYHKSGMPESVQIKTGLKNATDYTEQQTTGNKPKGVKDFNFNEAVRKYGDPRRAAEEYVKWCEKNGYTPKFEQFKDDPNYYKLLADFRLFDGEGRYSEQKAVNPRNILQEGWETELENSLTDKTMQEQVKAQVGSNENLMKGVERLLGKQRMDGAVREEMVARLKGALGKDNVESLKQNDFFDALEEAYSKTMGAEKAHEKVEVLRTNDGVVYGFAQGGKIVLNENVFNAETPIHEFTHIWVKVAQRENPKLWKKGKDLLKQSDEWKEVMEDELYKDIRGDEDAVASEVLARIVGRDGADYVRRLLDPDSKPLKRGGVYNQIREWLNGLFKSVRSIFAPSIRNLTFDEFKKMPLNTLFDEAEAKRFLEAKNRLEKEGALESDVTAGLELNATEGSRDYAAETRELIRRRLRGEDVTAELEQLRADRRAAEAARSVGSNGAGSGEPPIEPPTPPTPATPEPAPELPPTGYERPMSPIEMAQEAAIKAVADTKASLEQRNAARRELTASLRNIHKAMGLQKEYDRATVENVVNLCKMMVQSGLIDRSYVSNLTPLFTKIKGATGKQDLTSTVNDIMDVMLKSQERSVRNEIAKLLNTKGTKVDQNGVVTQAGLDIRGQHTMKELSEYMGKGSVIIDNHIAKLEEERAKIPDGHQERIDDIDDKILGSQLAKQFSQIEETHSVNIREAEEDLNFLKERYKAGEIGIKEYTEQKHALESLIRSYRMAQTDALWNQANALRYVIAGGKEGTRNWIEQQKERKNEIRHNAYSDMEGTSKRTQGDPTAMQKIMNSAIPKFFSSSLYTLQTMLKSLGNKHALGEGYLYNRFFRGWMEQRDAEITEYRDDMNVLNAKAKELTGHSYFGIYNMIQKLPKMTVEYMDGGEMVPHELDQGQLGYAYMVNKMEDGAAALRNMGITEEKMQEISNFLDPKLKEFYDWLQDDFLAGKWDGMNEVHKRLFGADMDRVANYIPLRRDRGAGTQKVDISQENEQPLQSTVVGSIIQRVHSNLGIDLKHNNAIDVVANHLLEATHWKHFSEWKRDANTLLSDTTFRNKVKNTTTIYGSGDVLWNRLNQVFQIAGGDYKPKAHSAGVDKAIVDMARKVNTAKVSMRVFTATKQLLSLPVFATECNTAVLLKNLGFLLSPVTSKNVAQNSFLWCLQNLPQFRERWVSRTAGETRLENGDLGWGYSRQKVLEAAGRIGLTPNAFIDVCTVAAGAKSIYEKRFAQYKKDGYSVEAADKKAKIDAETAFNESQQSSEKAFVSPIQVDRTAVALGLSTFRNASMGFERKFVDAIRNFRHLTDHKETVEFMKKQMERDGLTEAQAKDAAERLYRRALWRSTLNFLMFGFGAQMAWNVGGKLPYLIFGDDEEEKKKIVEQAAIHAGIGGWIEGLPAGDMLSEGMTNWAMNLIESGNPLEGNSFFEFDPDLLTVTSDFVKVTKALEGKNPLKGVTDFVNLLAQIYTGVNPQTFTDAGVAIYDACDGKPEVGNEALMCILRIMQCPQSQLDQMYIDELKMSAREAQKLTPEEVARRYAYYKAHKDTPYMWWMYNQDKKDEIVKKYEGDFNKKLNKDVKEAGGTPEDYHDLSESATTEKKTLEYRSKEIDALSAQGPEALMKAWEKERDKGAAADYKYMKSLMTRYQKDVYGKGKTPTDEDEAELYQETHGEDIKEQAQKIGRDLGFSAQDSFFQMSQYKAQHTSAKDPAMKKLSDNSGGFRYSEKGKFFDINDYQIKKPVEDAAKRANVEKVVKENRELLKRNYRNGWRMARIKALYKDIEAEIAEGKEGFERDKVKKNFEEILYILEDERRDAAEWERTHPKVKFTKKIETY